MTDFAELKNANEWVQSQRNLPPDKTEWEQGSWILPEHWRVLNGAEPGCGTAYCICGRVLVRAGHKLTIDVDPDIGTLVDGEQMSGRVINLLGLRILGLSSRWDYLFDADNDANRIDRIIHQIFDEYRVDYDMTEAAP